MRLSLVTELGAPFAVMLHVLSSMRLFLLDDEGLLKYSVAPSTEIHSIV